MRNDRRLPSLNALRAFETTGRRSSFQAAANELGVTQGAVAQQIRALEEWLGFRLFLRQQRGLLLTERGRAYCTDVQRAFEQLIGATNAALARQSVVTVSVTPTFAAKVLIPNLPVFAAEYPDIELRILATDAISDFERDGVDLAVRLTRPPFPLGISAQLLFSDMIVVASPALVAGRSLPLSPAEIAEYTLLYDGQSDWASFLEGRSARAIIHINQAALAIDAAASGQGLAMANDVFLSEAMTAGRLVRVVAERVTTDLAYYLVAPKGMAAGEAAAAVSRWIMKQVT